MLLCLCDCGVSHTPVCVSCSGGDLGTGEWVRGCDKHRLPHNITTRGFFFRSNPLYNSWVSDTSAHIAGPHCKKHHLPCVTIYYKISQGRMCPATEEWLIMIITIVTIWDLDTDQHDSSTLPQQEAHPHPPHWPGAGRCHHRLPPVRDWAERRNHLHQGEGSF